MNKRTKFAKLASDIEGKELAGLGMSLLALLGFAQEQCVNLFHMEFPTFVSIFTVAIVIKLAEQITYHFQYLFLGQSEQTARENI